MSTTQSALRIDPEFRALIPPPSAAERGELEESLRRDGCRDALVSWRGLLLDGHNRLDICTQLGLDYFVIEQDCADREDAKIWIIRNQFSRRNLAPYGRAELALQLEPLIAAKARARQIAGGRSKVPPMLAEPIETREEIARAAGLSHGTIDKAKVINEFASDDVKEQLRRGETTINREYSAIMQPIKRQQRLDEIEAAAAPSSTVGQRFPVLYADPPWRYEHVVTESRAIENQYPTLSLEELCELKVDLVGVCNKAADDAVLFLWATSPKLADAIRVVEAWGFTYRTCMVWVKDKIGMGYYVRQQHELLLIAAKGELPVPTPADRPSSVVLADREWHSVKPAIFYELIERMYPTLPKIELFARQARDGWAAWGNQA